MDASPSTPDMAAELEAALEGRPGASEDDRRQRKRERDRASKNRRKAVRAAVAAGGDGPRAKAARHGEGPAAEPAAPEDAPPAIDPAAPEDAPPAVDPARAPPCGDAAPATAITCRHCRRPTGYVVTVTTTFSVAP